jgi:hypothetical protein
MQQTARAAPTTAREYFCRRRPFLGEFICSRLIGSARNLLFWWVALTLGCGINDFMVGSALFAAK